MVRNILSVFLSDALYEGTQVVYEAELFGTTKKYRYPRKLVAKR